MSMLFFIIAFLGLIVAAVSGVAWIVGKLRHREPKARRVCIVAALVTVVSFVAFVATVEPVEKVEEPPATGSTEPAQSDAQTATEPPTETEPTVTTPAPEDTPQTTTEPPEETAPATSTSPEVTEPPTASTQPPEVTEPPAASEPVAVNLPLQERPVMNGTGTERIGTWARIITTKEYLATIPGRALYEHLEALAGNDYNWVNVTFGDGTGLYCYMDGYLIEYGCVDEKEGGAVEPGDGVDVRYFHFDSETGTYIEDEE